MNIRNLTTRPGFEFIFSVGIAAIFILPAAVMAQDVKNVEISITNGDTIINGKNIKELSPREREDALTDLNNIKGHKVKRKVMVFERRGPDGGGPGPNTPPPATAADGTGLGYSDLNIVHTPNGYMVGPQQDKRELHVIKRFRDSVSFRFNDGNTPPPRGDRGFNGDRPMNGGGPVIRRDNDPNSDADIDMGLARHPHMRTIGFKHAGSQTFNYSTVDDNGISTSASFHVSDRATGPQEGPGAERSELRIADLKLIPDFTTGKTLLMFNLPAKAPASVEFTDGKGSVLWAEKTSGGSLSKNFALPLNGIYYLNVKQGGKSAAKVILKEE